MRRTEIRNIKKNKTRNRNIESHKAGILNLVGFVGDYYMDFMSLHTKSVHMLMRWMVSRTNETVSDIL